MNSASISKRLFACLALLLAHFAAAPGQTPQMRPGGPAAEWREFTSEEGGFKVRFPAAHQYQKLPFNMGGITAEQHGVALKHLRDLKLGPHQGREYALVSERLGGAVGRAQLYITPKRTYWFAAVDGDPKRREGDLERFFSIKIEAR